MSRGLTLKRRIFAVPVLLALIAQVALGQAVSLERLAQIDAVVEGEIANKRLPGAVVLVGRKGRVVWRKSYGSRALEPAREPMTPDTIFDVASGAEQPALGVVRSYLNRHLAVLGLTEEYTVNQAGLLLAFSFTTPERMLE